MTTMTMLAIAGWGILIFVVAFLIGAVVGYHSGPDEDEVP